MVTNYNPYLTRVEMLRLIGFSDPEISDFSNQSWKDFGDAWTCTATTFSEESEESEENVDYADALAEAMRLIENRLDELRELNTDLNYDSDFNMTHDIAVVSGKIEGLKFIMDAVAGRLK